MELTRGDTGQFKFQRKDAEGHVILTTPDALYFTVKKSYQSPTVVFQKTIDDILSFINTKNLIPTYGKVFDFVDIRDAIMAQDERKINGKIVVKVE